MQLARNFLAGLSSSGASALVALAAVPVYLRLLGAEGYGLIGFYLTLQALLQVFDLGLTATANRELAQARARDELLACVTLLRAMALLAWCIAALITVVLLISAPWIAGGWLQLRELDSEQATTAVMLMAIALGLRWPAGLYQSMLLGREQVVRASVVTVTTSVAAHSGAMLLLALVSADVRLFAGWQVAVGLVHVVWMRTQAWSGLPAPTRERPHLRGLERVRGFSLTMVAIGAISLLFMNIDKLILSRMLPLPLFGQYMLATLIAGGIYSLVTPLFNAVYPRFSMLAAGSELTVLRQLYRDVTHLMASLLLPLAMLLAIAGEDLVSLWAGDRQLAANVAPILALLAVGSALHGVMYVPFALTLAMGAASMALRINVVLLVAVGPLLLGLTYRYGASGAAAAWVILHVAYVLFGGWVTNSALMPGIAGKWLVHDVGLPALVALLIGFAGGYLLDGGGAPLIHAAIGLALCAVAWIALWCLSARLRHAFRSPWRRVPV